MRAALFKAPRSIEVGDRPDASLSEPTDAVVRVALACVCGSDLWYYRERLAVRAWPDRP
jgi:threonine dehydrogenase-like Zn-dependent dehydrogenase